MVGCWSCIDLPASCSRCSRSMPTSMSSNLPWRSGPTETIDLALADDRLLELRDLVALRQVRIEIVLPVEDRLVVDLRLQPEPGADRLPDAFLVDDGQHAGHRRIDQADIGVGRRAERGRGAGKQLCLRGHLRMHLHADDHFPVAGGAGDEAFGFGRAGVDEGHFMAAVRIFEWRLASGKRVRMTSAKA